MSPVPGSSRGRAAVLLGLGVLAVTVGATAYLFLAQGHFQSIEVGAGAGPATARTAQSEGRKVVSYLIIGSISALLILLFVLGAYLVIRVGHLVARERIGGKPTEYVDAWGSYRLTDEQISAATAEGEPDEDNDSPDAPRPPPDDPSSRS